jgi:ABC transporter, permease protein
MYLIVLPAVIFVLVFNYAPMFGIVIAFQDYKILEGVSGSEWVGFKAFRDMFFLANTSTYRLLRNTLYISIIRILTNFPLILLFALLIREIKNRAGRSAIQTVAYIPYFISWVAVSGIAYNLFSADEGLINKMLVAFGGKPVSWYTEEEPWWWILALSSLWKGMGWSTLIYMSAMGSIDGELYDACLIDGGGRWQQAIKRYSFLDKKCHLIGFSRGGLYAFNFVMAYPQRVKSVYLDAPVLDLRSWPRTDPKFGEIDLHEQVMKEYGFKSEEEFENYGCYPVGRLGEYFKLNIPTLLIAGTDDTTVTYSENSQRMIGYCAARDKPFIFYVKLGADHHPHSFGNTGGIDMYGRAYPEKFMVYSSEYKESSYSSPHEIESNTRFIIDFYKKEAKTEVKK